MEDRRRSDDVKWENISNFIQESREYRIRDEITQKYQVENIEALKNQVKTQNGRVFTLEKWKEEVEVRIRQKKDSNDNWMARLTVICATIMALSAIIILWKK